MYSSKIFFKLCLIATIILLIVGIFMKIYDIESHGFYISKSGKVVNGTLSSNGTIIIGVIIFCFCITGFLSYKKRKYNNEKMREIEKNEERLGKKYNIYKIRKINKRKAAANSGFEQ